MGKTGPFNVQKKAERTYLALHTKVNSGWIKVLNVKGQTKVNRRMCGRLPL